MGVGDFDGDGDVDIAAGNINSASMSIFLGVGNGTFAAKVDYTTGTQPRSLAVGDLDDDGDRT